MNSIPRHLPIGQVSFPPLNFTVPASLGCISLGPGRHQHCFHCHATVHAVPRPGCRRYTWKYAVCHLLSPRSLGGPSWKVGSYRGNTLSLAPYSSWPIKEDISSLSEERGRSFFFLFLAPFRKRRSSTSLFGVMVSVGHPKVCCWVVWMCERLCALWPHCLCLC